MLQPDIIAVEMYDDCVYLKEQLGSLHLQVILLAVNHRNHHLRRSLCRFRAESHHPDIAQLRRQGHRSRTETGIGAGHAIQENHRARAIGRQTSRWRDTSPSSDFRINPVSSRPFVIVVLMQRHHAFRKLPSFT